MVLRAAAGTLGLFFAVQAIHWIVNPGAAAEVLGMPLLDGIALSTQMGDIGGFFFALGALIVSGVYRSNPHWLRAGALLLASVAGMRTLAWLLHGAELTLAFIGVEIFAAGLLLFVAARFEMTADGAGSAGA